MCGLEVTATKADAGVGWCCSSLRGNREGLSFGLRSRMEAQLLSLLAVCLWDSDIISLSISFPNYKIRMLPVVTSQLLDNGVLRQRAESPQHGAGLS